MKTKSVISSVKISSVKQDTFAEDFLCGSLNAFKAYTYPQPFGFIFLLDQWISLDIKTNKILPFLLLEDVFHQS